MSSKIFSYCTSPSAKPLQVCAGCFNAWYCCKDHQTVHWSDHKTFCAPLSIRKNQYFKLIQNSETGDRACLAIKPIPAGTDILRDEVVLKSISYPIATKHLNQYELEACVSIVKQLWEKYRYWMGLLKATKKFESDDDVKYLTMLSKNPS